MRFLIILLFVFGCAKKENAEHAETPQKRPYPGAQCEFIQLGDEYMFCRGTLCCNGSYYSRYANCTNR